LAHLLPANVEAHLAKIRSDREVWAKNNPNIVKLVQDLALPHQTIPSKNQYAADANRIEAELMNLSTYRVESGNTAASGGGLISLYQATGSVGAASSRCGSLRHL